MKKRTSKLRETREREIRFWWNQGLNTAEIAKRCPRMSEAMIYNLLDTAIHRNSNPACSAKTSHALAGKGGEIILPSLPASPFYDALLTNDDPENLWGKE